MGPLPLWDLLLNECGLEQQFGDSSAEGSSSGSRWGDATRQRPLLDSSRSSSDTAAVAGGRGGGGEEGGEWAEGWGGEEGAVVADAGCGGNRLRGWNYV